MTDSFADGTRPGDVEDEDAEDVYTPEEVHVGAIDDGSWVRVTYVTTHGNLNQIHGSINLREGATATVDIGEDVYHVLRSGVVKKGSARSNRRISHRNLRGASSALIRAVEGPPERDPKQDAEPVAIGDDWEAYVPEENDAEPITISAEGTVRGTTARVAVFVGGDGYLPKTAREGLADALLDGGMGSEHVDWDERHDAPTVGNRVI